jgi:hypothetical protein
MRANEFLGLNENAVGDLEKDLKNPHSYDAIDHMMQSIAKKHGITGKELHDRFVKKHGQVPDDWIKDRVTENFADGKKPGRKGLSKRVGIPKKASLSQLQKIASSSTGERRRMAQWQLNMRRGKAKKNK